MNRYADRAAPRQRLYHAGPRQIGSGHYHMNFNSPAAPSVDVQRTLDVNHEVQRSVDQLIDHPRFEDHFPTIKSCLQLSDLSWAAFSQLREDPEAKQNLESSHCSLWQIPPDDVWANVAHIRQEPRFSKFRSGILAEVDHAYHSTYQAITAERSRPIAIDQLGMIYTDVPQRASPNTEPHQGLNTTPRIMTETEIAPSGLDSRQPQVPLSATNLIPITSPIGGKPRTKQAPKGTAYYCPSQGCSKSYVRAGHYCKHLKKNHPDFGPQHPYHSIQDSLKPRTSSSHSGSRSLFSNPRSPDPSRSIHGYDGPSSRGFATSRRGSHVSASSYNSAGASSSAIDDTIEESFLAVSEMPGHDLLIPDDGSMWGNMGGGTVMNGVGINMSSANYTTTRNY